MKLFLPKYPAILRMLYPGRISKLNKPNAIYLTFDDGPVPEVTPWVLDLLKNYKAKATFFCIGDNVQKHPEIFQRIITEGHAIGNHTFNHLNGWKTSTSDYIENTNKAEQILSDFRLKDFEETENTIENSASFKPHFPLFRPPYGKIKNRQSAGLKKLGFKIVMWDVISGDYDQEFTAELCLKNVLNNSQAGSTIVFHDSKKAFKNLKIILPEVLNYYSEKGMEFRSLTDAL